MVSNFIMKLVLEHNANITQTSSNKQIIWIWPCFMFVSILFHALYWATEIGYLTTNFVHLPEHPYYYDQKSEHIVDASFFNKIQKKNKEKTIQFAYCTQRIYMIVCYMLSSLRSTVACITAMALLFLLLLLIHC